MGFLHCIYSILISCWWSIDICFTFDVQFRKKTNYEQYSDGGYLRWVVRWISNRSNACTWWSLIVKKCEKMEHYLLSAKPLLVITLSALIIKPTTVAATTSLSFGLLLNNNKQY